VTSVLRRALRPTPSGNLRHSRAAEVAAKKKAETKVNDKAFRLAEQTKRAQVLWPMAEGLERNGKTAGAVRFYRQILDECPESPLAAKASERIRALGKK
jgi:hypothetical protein